VTDSGSGVPPEPPEEEPRPSDAWAQPPSPTPPPPPPSAQPPTAAPPTAAPPSGTGYQYTAPAPTWAPAQPAYGPQKTNSLGIVSLIFGIANFIICPFIGAIVAIVTGHIASGQIKRSEGREGGKGLARAGTILGYVGLGLTVLGIVGAIVAFGVFGDDITRASLRSDANEFVDNAQQVAQLTGGEVRDPEVLRRAYANTNFDDGFDSMTLADGTSILTADASDWENAGWRVQLHGNLFKSADICVLIPQAVDGSPGISNRACTNGTSA
jgi:hypothetical protein